MPVEHDHRSAVDESKETHAVLDPQIEDERLQVLTVARVGPGQDELKIVPCIP